MGTKGPVLARRCPARGTISQGIQEHLRKLELLYFPPKDQVSQFRAGRTQA